MSTNITRRHFLQGLAAAGAALSTPLTMASSTSSSTLRNGSQAPTPIWPGGVEKPLMPYTPAIKAAGWLFIAGQLATDFETGVAPQARSDGSPAEKLALQSRYVMANVAKTVEAGGLDIRRDTVQIWQWLASERPTMQDFARGDNWAGIPVAAHYKERAQYMSAPGPVSSAMGVKALAVKGTLMEIDVIAVDDGGSNVSFDLHAQPGHASAMRRGDWVFLNSEPWQRPQAVDGVEQQAEQILQHLSQLAEKAGSSLRRAVKAEVYIGSPADYKAMEVAWKRWFPVNPPARVVMPCMGMTGGTGRRIEIALTLLTNESSKTIDTIHSTKAPRPFSHEPQAIKAGNLLFLSQQMPTDGSGALAPGMVRDPNFPFYGLPTRKQMSFMLENVAAICEAAGSSLENVVKRVCFHDHGEHFAEAMDEWARHFPKLKPASTTLVLGGDLVVPGAHTMLDIIAYVP